MVFNLCIVLNKFRLAFIELWERSMAHFWKSWECFIDFFFSSFNNFIVWESIVFGFIGFHLRNIVYEMSWFVEKLKFFSIDEITELIFNLNNEFDHIKTVKTVIGEGAIKGDAGFFGGSEIVFSKRKNVI